MIPFIAFLRQLFLTMLSRFGFNCCWFQVEISIPKSRAPPKVVELTTKKMTCSKLGFSFFGSNIGTILKRIVHAKFHELKILLLRLELFNFFWTIFFIFWSFLNFFQLVVFAKYVMFIPYFSSKPISFVLFLQNKNIETGFVLSNELKVTFFCCSDVCNFLSKLLSCYLHW